MRQWWRRTGWISGLRRRRSRRWRGIWWRFGCGQCVTCTPNADSKCYLGNLHYYDSCGKLGALKQTCTNGCEGSACKLCTPHATTKCYAGDVYYYDSCGKQEELKQACAGSCVDGQCAASIWRCTTANPPNCFCIVTADVLTYPATSCPTSPCCFRYMSTSGDACYCGSYDAATCDAYVKQYNATKQTKCPP
jgi:hypothetical protein